MNEVIMKWKNVSKLTGANISKLSFSSTIKPSEAL